MNGRGRYCPRCWMEFAPGMVPQHAMPRTTIMCPGAGMYTRERKPKSLEGVDVNREFIEGQIDYYQRRLAAIEAFGDDLFEEGDVLAFRYSFSPGGKPYTYAAVKANNLWYTTGPKSPKGYTWEELVAWFVQGFDVEVWAASEMMKVY